MLSEAPLSARRFSDWFSIAGKSADCGRTQAIRMPMLRQLVDKAHPLKIAGWFEQNNFSVVYGDKVFLKIFRRLDEGMNPELEMGRFLTRKEFPNCPPLAGALEYVTAEERGFTLAVATRFIHEARPPGNTLWTRSAAIMTGPSLRLPRAVRRHPFLSIR